MLSSLRPRAGVVLLAALSSLPFSASAGTPDRGTLSPTSAQLSYSAGPFNVPNATPTPAVDNGPVCDSTSPCDSYRLTVTVPADYANAHPNLSVRIALGWDDPTGASDYDLWVYEGDVDELDGSDGGKVDSASSANPEVAVFYPEIGTRVYTIKVVPYAPNGETVTVNISFENSDPCAASGAPAGASISSGIARDLKTLSPTTAYGAFVHFSSGTPAEHRALLQRVGLSPKVDFERYAAAVYAVGPLAGFRALAAEPSVRYLEENRRLRFLSNSAGWATRARVAQEPAAGGPFFAADGEILRGQGVTVAIVDSGVNAAHPDFAGRVMHNWKVTGDPIATGELVYQDVGYGTTDTTSGHGTHVAGIALGDGAASTGDYPVETAAPRVRGTFTGAAPAATLLAYSVGETPDPTGIAGVALLIYIDASLQHLLDNFDSYTPKVRVVSLSLGDGGGSPYNPGDVTSCLVKGLVAKGANVVWAAGNDGGDGSADQTSSFCKDPTPGVLCVANYDDGGTGSTGAGLASSSSRGHQGKPQIYPDIAAPGSNITATCLEGGPGQVTCSSGAETAWAPFYGTISGTSMATPHVSGTIALIAQARPDLTPAQIEDTILDTARKVGTNGPYEVDPQNAGGSINFGFGAGLLNIPAVLRKLQVRSAGLPAAGAETVVLDGDADGALPGAADVVALSARETAAPLVPGVVYRLTVRDALDFGASTALDYQLRQNVNGTAYLTTVSATPDAVTVAGAGSNNNALASEVTREGNVVTFVVPYANLGFPPTGAPVHNVSVRASDAGGVLDFAPSPAASAGGEADLTPMYGKPYTVLRDSGKPFAGDPCVAPGLTVMTDAYGDQNNGLPTGQDDLQYTALGEPAEFDRHLVFTIKVDNLNPAPTNYRWITYFKVPEGTEYWVGMSNSEGVTAYNYGTSQIVDNPVAGVRTYTVVGDLDSASGFDADGTIRLVLDKSLVGLKTGDQVTDIVTSIRQSTPDSAGAAGLTTDSAVASTPYTIVGNETCRDKSSGGSYGSGSGVVLGGSLGLPGLLVLGLGALLGMRRRRR